MKITGSASKLSFHSEEIFPRTSSTPRKLAPLILLVLLFSLVLRVAVAMWSPSLYYPDEIYQTQEPAHRIAYGYGVSTWEFRDAARSMVFPSFLAEIMRSTDWLGKGSDGYLFGIAFVLASLSLIVVWFGFSWGYRLGGMPAAVVAFLACATWYEFIYFGPKAFNEFIAGHLLLIGICLGTTESSAMSASRWRIFAAGLFCGLVIALRMQLAPAVFVVVLYFCWKNSKNTLLPLGIGLALPILLFGLVDAVTWSYPFQSYIVNFTYNVIQDRSNHKPWYALLVNLFLRTGPLPLLAVWGARRSPFLGLVALAILVPHSIIYHKEYRFIYPMLPIMVTLSAVGLTDLVNSLNVRLKSPRPTFAVTGFCAGFFFLLAAAIASQFPFWREDSGNLRAFKSLSHDQSLCGLAIQQDTWSHSGGYTYLHRNVPIFLFPDLTKTGPLNASFNAMISTKPLEVKPQGFELSNCWRGACLYRRPSICIPGDRAYEFNEVLKRIEH